MRLGLWARRAGRARHAQGQDGREPELVASPDRPPEGGEHETRLDPSVLEDDGIDVRAHLSVARKRQDRDDAKGHRAWCDLRKGESFRRDDLDLLPARSREPDDVGEARRRLRRVPRFQEALASRPVRYTCAVDPTVT